MISVLRTHGVDFLLVLSLSPVTNFGQPVSNMTDSIDRLFCIDVTTDYTQGNSEESETLFKWTIATDHFQEWTEPNLGQGPLGRANPDSNPLWAKVTTH